MPTVAAEAATTALVAEAAARMVERLPTIIGNHSSASNVTKFQKFREERKILGGPSDLGEKKIISPIA